MKVNQPTILVDGQKLMKSDSDFLEAQHTLAQQGFQIDPNTFEPVAIDPLHFDYPNHLMPSMDSPNFNMDYTQVCCHLLINFVSHFSCLFLLSYILSPLLHHIYGPFILHCQEID